jgi:outer membrane murein-binding lipoprotein Lpp
VQRLTTSPAEQRSLPEILSDAEITARTDLSILPGILDNLAQPSTIADFTDPSQAIASVPCIPSYNLSTHTIGVSQQPQEASGVGRVSGILAIAAVAGVVLSVYKKTISNQKQRDSDAELITWLQQTKCAIEVELEVDERVIEALRSRHDEAKSALNGKVADLEHQVETLLQQSNNAGNDNVQLRNDLDANDEKMQKLCADHATTVVTLNEQIAGLSAQLETLKEEREEAIKQGVQLDVYLEARNGEIQKLGSTLAAKEDYIRRLDAEHTKHVGALDVKLAHLLSQLGALVKQQEQIHNQNVQQATDPEARGGIIAELTQE